MTVAPGTAVVVLSARLGPVLPAAALPAVRDAAAVYADALPFEVAGASPAPAPDKLGAQASVEPVVLLTLDPAGPAASALAGASVITTAEPAGAAVLDAVALMDRLRSPGGCPWDAEQTHASLRQYLLEETYELLEAIDTDDRVALREELGDVLLQVLFHARIAAEPVDGSVDGSVAGSVAGSVDGGRFTVDDIAAGLVAKLVGRHPHVFGDAEHAGTAADLENTWERLKRDEKQRTSAVDGVALGQPAAALAAKLVSRTARAGLPADLLPDGPSPGEQLFAAVARAKLAGTDPETELRAAAQAFAASVRAAEAAARAAGLDPATLTPTQWRTHFPPS